jgi:hypothetical protein
LRSFYSVEVDRIKNKSVLLSEKVMKGIAIAAEGEDE